MGTRKLFLLFFSAMAVSIIIMMVVYGLFIKDMDMDLEVKNPESAPSPIDPYHQTYPEDEPQRVSQAPARVDSPQEEHPAPGASSSEHEADRNNPHHQEAPDELPPMASYPGQTAPLPGRLPDSTLDIPIQPSSEDNETQNSPGLHYVFMDGFSSKDAAEQAIQLLQDRNLPVRPYIRNHQGQTVLQFGVFSDRQNADELAQQLRRQNVYVKVD